MKHIKVLFWPTSVPVLTGPCVTWKMLTNVNNIVKWYIEKGAMSIITFRRIDKRPTPKQRFSDNFPTARTDKMTNSWQIPRGDGQAWNWLSHYYYFMHCHDYVIHFKFDDIFDWHNCSCNNWLMLKYILRRRRQILTEQ